MKFILVTLMCLVMACSPRYTYEVGTYYWIDNLEKRGATIINVDTIYTNGMRSFIVKYKCK